MVFSSHLFIFFFLPVFLAVYHALPGRGRNAFLTMASYVFYGWGEPWCVTLMMFQTLVDWVAGRTIAGRWGARRGLPAEPLDPQGGRTGAQRAALVVALASNLLLLGFFKYFNFGVDSWNAVMSGLGLEGATWDTALTVVLPLGISFYTFQSMSYAIDVYRGDAAAIDSLADYACYVAMFPQLVAGPIVRFRDVASQFTARVHSVEKFVRGVAFFSLGLGKKVLIANPCGTTADLAFGAGDIRCADAWLGAVSYSMQIYFDFSGYSDMAIGLGLMTGWVFVKNFDSPYRSASITEFWRRWHISLSTWLRDNLYVPLGGNRKGLARTHVNLAIVMLLGGLWHGASWTFVVWGAIHGVMLAVERMAGIGASRPVAPAGRVLRVAATFAVVTLAWVFFRSSDLSRAVAYLRRMAGFGEAGAQAELLAGVLWQPHAIGTLLVAAVITWMAPQAWDFTKDLRPTKVIWIAVVLVASLFVMESQAYNPFIYFIF